MSAHEVVNRDEWNAARAKLLAREKEHTRLGDELARERRELPWLLVEKEYSLATDEGTRTLAELFDGRGQLLVYHFMFGPNYQAGCPTCTSMADGVNGLIPHLNAHDVTMLFVSQAPLEKLQAYKRRMGWSFPWASAAGSDFNFDLGFSRTEEQTREAFAPMLEAGAPRVVERNASSSGTDATGYLMEGPGFSAFVLDDGSVYQTYSTTARGPRVPDGLLRDPRPGAEGPRRGRPAADLDPPARRVRTDGLAVPRIQAAADRLALVGADPRDDEDMRARKALLVLISVLILPVAVVWGALYLAFGSPVGVVPLVYFAVLLGAIVVFSRTRDFPWLLRVNQVDILLAPTLSMIPLGGFLDSGGVGLWGILAPLGALVFSDVRSAARWYAAFLVVFLGSGIAGEIIGPVWALPPVWFTSTMLALNIAVGGAIVFTLLAVFAKQRADALAALRQEQAKSENLLLNILPRSIADKLKAADPADRRPLRVGLDPLRRRGRLHALVGAARARRGGRPPRPPLQPLRRARRPVRAREDQDHRRLLHGRPPAFRRHAPTMLAPSR